MNPEDLDWGELRSSSECLAGDIFFGSPTVLYPRQSSVISVNSSLLLLPTLSYVFSYLTLTKHKNKDILRFLLTF